MIKRESTIKFLGVLLDENFLWKTHIDCIHSKISKNIGILYKARYFLNQQCLKQLYFSFIHSYLNYANIAWGTAPKSYSKKLANKQKHACRTIFYKEKSCPSKPLMKELKALNIYELNIYQTMVFMYKVRNNTIRRVFNKLFSINENRYRTRATGIKFSKPLTRNTFSRKSISSHA